jgi:tetratricopeptide (TPR) repeat protein
MVGWAFVAVGYFLIRWHDPAIEDLLHARTYSLALFPNHVAAQYFFMGFFILGLLAAAGLCCVTAWGVGHQRTWSRWTGLMPCLYLLLGYPYLTPIGALGLYYLWTQTTVKRRTLTGAEFWNPSRQSGWMLTASLLGWFVARMAFSGLEIRAFRTGLPRFGSGGPGMVPFLFLVWIQVAIHECGHALAAVLVGFRVKVLAMGPLVLSKDARGRHAGFDWRGLFLLSGYMGAVPVSPHGWRIKQMIVIAAGPLTSLLAGGVLLGVSFLLPGTGLANLWPLVAMAAVLGIYIGTINLLPLGYCDGTMLFHLLLRTRRGEELTSRILHGANLNGRQESARDYEDDVLERREALRQLLDSPAPDPVTLGCQYIALGTAEIATEHQRDAELHVTQGLTLLPEGAVPASEATGWECLQILRTARHDRAGATEAYQKALTAARLLRNDGQSQPLRAGLSIASLHVRAQAWAETLEETAAELALCGEDQDARMQTGVLLHFRAQALLQTGCVEAGLAAVDRAAGIFRAQSSGVPGPHHLGMLGESLWNAGRTEGAVSLVTESIVLLEARGAIRTATAFRLCLSELLRSDGRVAHAACVLPPVERIGPGVRRHYYERRGAIRRSGGKLREAIADLSAAAAVCEHEVPGDEVKLAGTQARLADTLTEAGDLEQAEPLARQAQEVLAAAGHPDCAGACITLAVIGWRKDGSPGGYVGAALRCWQAATLLLPADKARDMEEAARRLESAGLVDAAAQCRAAAEQQWLNLGAVPLQEALAASGGD